MALGRETVGKDILERIYQWCYKDCHLLWQLWLPSAPPIRWRLVTRWGHLHPHGTMLSPSTPFLAPNNFVHVLLNGICLWESRMPEKKQREAFHLVLTQSIHQQMMFCDINSGSDSTLGAKLRPTRSKFQGNWAALWDNWRSESARLIPIRPSHPDWKLTCSRRTCMATLQKGKRFTPRYLIRCFLNRSPENTVCSDMEGERDPSVKSSGQEGQSNNFRNGERFPCSLKGGEEQKAVHFRQLWVSCCFNHSQTAKTR